MSASGVNLSGDSSQLIQYRENLFNKINNEINSFTPYERFLYFDGQSQTTSSAPGLSKNYALNNVPVAINDLEQIIDGGDGFDTVYHHTINTDTHTNIYHNLFANTYYVEDKPFFNYSGSIYLSFLMKGNNPTDISFQNANAQNSTYTGKAYSLPKASMYKNEILNPETSGPGSGSNWRRYIFEASQSYWIPTVSANHNIHQIEDSQFGLTNPSQIEVLHGSVKTGSQKIADYTGVYSNLCTVVTGSFQRFFGSVMPAGELFRLYQVNSLTSSLSGSWNVDDQTSGSTVTEAMLTDFSGRANTGSLRDQFSYSEPPTIADGLELNGINYGQSIQFISESAEEIMFKTDELQFSRSSSFSLSIWAKRFHPNTGSADPTARGAGGSPGETQEIFVRGNTQKSYGIDYHFKNNQVKAGVRGDSGGFREEVSHTMSDDLLNWHHLVFTFQSGSSTGIKLYVDGELKGTSTTTGDLYSITGSSDIPDTGGDGNKLSMGGFGVIGGTGGFFNGFLQYPRVYGRTLTQRDVTQLYNMPNGISETKITDVRISYNNPSEAQPFSQLYHTSSTAWTSWYDGIYDSASAFDTENIHSLENNLPLYIQESNDYDELKDFLALQGEQYDVIRNHIDSLGTIHTRGYKKLDSPPENTYPMLLENLGYQSINPFSGSLSETLGQHLSSVSSIDDIKDNTWRKTLNNLIYIYKSKGTENSVRALLNVYGYPPDVLSMQEFGGSTANPIQNSPGFIKDTPPVSSVISDTDLRRETGSISFTNKKQKLHNYIFQTDADRTINTSWWMNNADINTIEFVYKHGTTTSTQTILKSSGSGTETLWDLRLIPSTDGISSSFEFRLNNSNTGSNAIASNAISMSLDYNIMTDGQLWNVMLQRVSSSVSGSGTNEYRLHSSLQENTAIKTYSYTTMSVSGGITNTYVTGGANVDSNYFANQNWISSGSRHYLSSSNLTIGGDGTFSGSLTQIKSWTTALSHSRFRQHTLNKFSTVGNSIDSHRKELIYHYKLNENYVSSSISSSLQTPQIVDSSPKTTLTTDYSIPISAQLITSSNFIYGFDFVDVIQLGLQDNNQSNNNNNNIILNPSKRLVGNLNPTHTIIGIKDKPDYITSPKLEINRSPQDTINNLILNNMDSFNFELYYGNPQYQYTSSYTEFDILRKEFFKAHPILVNTNKFIRAHENILNQSIADGLKSIVPARSTLSDRSQNVGVTIKPTILEKQKRQFEKHSIETNPNSPSGSIDMVVTSSYKTGFNLISILESPKTGSISMGNSYVTESFDSVYITPKFLQSNQYTSSLELPKSSSITVGFHTTGSLELPQSGSISMGSAYVTESFGNKYITPYFIQNNGFTASIDSPKSGSIEEITVQHTKEFVNIHDSWGTGTNDTHFINLAGGTGSNGDYNVGHIESRYQFRLIGDTEYYSSSFGHTTDFTNFSYFYNREMIDDGVHQNTRYDSYIPTTLALGGKPASPSVASLTLKGKMIGKTKYFFTGSDGSVILPRNHVSRYTDHYLTNMRNGTQNTGPGILNVQQEDYASASFYRVKITGGETQAYIGGAYLPTIGSDDKLNR